MKVIIILITLVMTDVVFSQNNAELFVDYIDRPNTSYKISLVPVLFTSLFDENYKTLAVGDRHYAETPKRDWIRANFVWSVGDAGCTDTIYYGVYQVKFWDDQDENFRTVEIDFRDANYRKTNQVYVNNDFLVKCEFTTGSGGGDTLGKPYATTVYFTHQYQQNIFVYTNTATIWQFENRTPNQSLFKNFTMTVPGSGPPLPPVTIKVNNTGYSFSNGESQSIGLGFGSQMLSLSALYRATTSPGNYLYFSRWENGSMFDTSRSVNFNGNLAQTVKAYYVHSTQDAVLSGTTSLFTIKETLNFTTTLAKPKSDTSHFEWFIKYDFNGVWQQFGNQTNTASVVTTPSTGYGFSVKCRLKDYVEKIGVWSEQWRVSWTGDIGDPQIMVGDGDDGYAGMDVSASSGEQTEISNPDILTAAQKQALLLPIREMVRQMTHQFRWTESDPAIGTGSETFDLLAQEIRTDNLESKTGVTNGVLPLHTTGMSSPVREMSKTITSVPVRFKLNANYPNPFNPSTTISFDLPETSEISLEIYNSAGQRVRVLASGIWPAGVHALSWDAKDTKGSSLPSGVYIYRIKTPRFTQSKRMLLIK